MAQSALQGGSDQKIVLAHLRDSQCAGMSRIALAIAGSADYPCAIRRHVAVVLVGDPYSCDLAFNSPSPSGREGEARPAIDLQT